MVALSKIGQTASRTIENGVNRIANSNFMKKAFSERAGEIAATVALASTTTKDAVNCIYYTKQSLENKKIPEEKRKFVAAIDLSNGVLNVVSQLTLGAYIKNKAPQLFDMAFKNTKLKGGTLSAAKGGFILLTTLVFAQIILKRVLTPFLATPIAHYIKEYADKKTKGNNPDAGKVEEKQSEAKPVVIDNKLNLLSLANNNTFKSFNQLIS